MSNTTQSVAADILGEFLEVAIHSILYVRGLYPTGVFENRKKYGIPVHMCVHPDVGQYVSHVTQGVHTLLECNQANQVSMVILNSHSRPIERFVFEIMASYNTDREDSFLFRLEQSLRAFIMKLNICDTMLKPLPNDVTWTVHVHTKESSAQKMETKQSFQDFPWIEADERQTSMSEATMVPLKAMAEDLVKMQLFVEESSDKAV